MLVQVNNADRMMISANPLKVGVELVFADGRRGVIPFADMPEIRELSDLARIELPNPYQVILKDSRDRTVELPWDFARHYCDKSYRPRVEAIAAKGTQALGKRVRKMRESIGMTQEALASAAGIGRVTLVRIESGEQSPRLQTLLSLAQALGHPVQELVQPP